MYYMIIDHLTQPGIVKSLVDDAKTKLVKGLEKKLEGQPALFLKSAVKNYMRNNDKGHKEYSESTYDILFDALIATGIINHPYF